MGRSEEEMPVVRGGHPHGKGRIGGLKYFSIYGEVVKSFMKQKVDNNTAISGRSYCII